jgi:acetyltransferase-like isoleucine patch superfamily enzyme
MSEPISESQLPPDAPAPGLEEIPGGAEAWVRRQPPPLRGGPLTLLRFMASNHMLRPMYLRMLLRLLRHKYLTSYGRRIELDGIAFIGRNVRIQIRKGAKLRLGRWCWIGNGTKIRIHGGEVEIGAKTVIGEEATFSAYEHISLGRESVIADRVMFIDFDHCVMEVERPIRQQGIYHRPVRVGHNAWLGYGAAILRGVTVGDNCVIGTYAVVTRDLPDNAVATGVPAKVIRTREAPRWMRWE